MTIKVLFLCTGNSARSILAEAILNKIGEGNYVAYSAGSNPVGEVNPFALKLLSDIGYETKNLKSQKMDEFVNDDLDYVITVCDNANNECPYLPGNVKRIHWGLDDPAAFKGGDSDKYIEFKRTYEVLMKKLKDFVDF